MTVFSIIQLLTSINNHLAHLDTNVYALLHRFFPTPTTLVVNLEGASSMASAIKKTVGQTVHGVAQEQDNTTTPPTPFPIVPANLVWTQDTTTFGTLVVNPDGSFDLTGAAAGVVTVTCTDSVSNPSMVLTNTAVITFVAKPEVPNQLDIVLS